MNNMERFTQRARRVLTLAEESAAQLKQSVIGTEHVLVGLLREERGLASRVLHHLRVEQKRVIELIAELSPKSEDAPVQAVPELSAETKQLLELAIEEARLVDQHYIGTEHLLLGLVRQEESMAVRLLKRFDIHPEQVQQETKRLLAEATPPPEPAVETEKITQETPSAFPATGSPHMTMTLVTKVLEMVSEDKLTTSQASELLKALELDMTLTASGKASFASMVNRAGMNLKRRIHITVSDAATKEKKFEMVNPLDSVLRFIDYFLKLVADNDYEALILDGDDVPIITELRIEKDEPSE